MSYFLINFQWIFLASLSIFALVQETISSSMSDCQPTMILFLSSFLNLTLTNSIEQLVEVLIHKHDDIYRNRYDDKMPLAVIVTEEHDSKKLQLATPHECKNDVHNVGYYFNHSDDENGPKEKLMLACPPVPDSYSIQYQAEIRWKTTHTITSDKSRLFFLINYGHSSRECRWNTIPSIQKLNEKDADDGEREYCRKSQAEMYEVGYPVSSDNEGKDIRFLSVYKICHSMVKGNGATLYSIHRIVAPDLLLQKYYSMREFPEIDPWNEYHKSYLDENLSTIKSLKNNKEYYAYQFVGIDDMPTKSLEPPTRFIFNYTPITKNVDLIIGMLRADFYIRLYSKKNNKILTLYSGTYKRRVKNTGCISCKSTIKSFWRIIMDDDSNAIILVTQHSQKQCVEEAYLCESKSKVKKYEKGGCIYTCSLNSQPNRRILDQLDLPQLKVTGDLDFTFRIDKTEKVTFDGRLPSDTTSSKETDIIDFLDNESFMDAVRSIDEDIAGNIIYVTDKLN